jgi:hypothetical protein
MLKPAWLFSIPGPATDSHGNVIGDKDIPIAVQDNTASANEASSILYKRQKLTAAYEALSRHGFRWTNYDER